jgi:hypothetical protein
MLPSLAAAFLNERGEQRVAHGHDLGPADVREIRASTGSAPGNDVRLIDRAGRLVGIGQPTGAPGLLHPSVVLG